MKGMRWCPALALALVLAAPARAAVFTVGPDGTHSTIQAAVTAAIDDGGENEIRIARGTFVENVFLSVFTGSPSIRLSGDWNADFTTRGDDPSRTVIDGNAAGVTLDLGTVRDASYVIESLTVTNGDHRLGGMSVGTMGAGQVTIRNIRVVGNRSSDASNVAAGGVNLFAAEESSITFTESVVMDNQALGEFAAAAGGLSLGASGNGTITARFNRIESNLRQASDPGGGSGVDIQVQGASVVNFSDNVVHANHAATEASFGDGGSLSAFGSDPPGTPRIVARRNRWTDNTSDASITRQVALATSGPGTRIELTDSLIASSGEWGLDARLFGGVVRLTNLTVTGHSEIGIDSFLGSGSSTGTLSIYNTIAFDNGMDLDLDFPSLVDQGGNLIGVDPGFVNPGAGNFRLPASSPAVDMGVAAPPGGLGPLDLGGGARVEGSAVDVGAYEYRLEPCSTSATTLCLIDDRFRVELSWRPGGGTAGPATAVGLTDDAGYFFFNNPNNIEVVVKMSNACTFNDRFWVFAAGLTNVEAMLTVTDTETGEVRSYDNDLGTAFVPIQDTSAFATCP